MSESLMRFITILVIISIIGFVLFFGDNLSLVLSIFIISVYAYYEWLKFSSKSSYNLIFFIIVISLLYSFPIIDIKYFSFITLSFWIILILMMFYSSKLLSNLIKKYSIYFGFFIIATFFLHLIYIYLYGNIFLSDIIHLDKKSNLILLIVIITSVDTFAYISGKLLGSNKIVPHISPNKTIEGYLGGYVSTIIIFMLLSYILQIPWSFIDILFLTFIIILAFCGDLFVSFIKRNFQIKDTGNLLPGHGGLLDRLDSYLPSTSLFFIWVFI